MCGEMQNSLLYTAVINALLQSSLLCHSLMKKQTKKKPADGNTVFKVSFNEKKTKHFNSYFSQFLTLFRNRTPRNYGDVSESALCDFTTGTQTPLFYPKSKWVKQIQRQIIFVACCKQRVEYVFLWKI